MKLYSLYILQPNHKWWDSDLQEQIFKWSTLYLLGIILSIKYTLCAYKSILANWVLRCSILRWFKMKIAHYRWRYKNKDALKINIGRCMRPTKLFCLSAKHVLLLRKLALTDAVGIVLISRPVGLIQLCKLKISNHFV